MDFVIEFNKAAFEHEISEEDIKNGGANVVGDDKVEYDAFFEEGDPDAEDKYLLIGFDCMRT